MNGFSQPDAKQTHSETPKERREKIAKLSAELIKNLYDRDDVVKPALLGVLAGHNVFLYGPPGTGKSMIARRLAAVFSSDSYFEHLMHRFCTPEEIFGPVSIGELKNDRYRRLTEGYLAEANVAFLDEIWKSSPAVLNTLLTLVNEKKFHNGSEVLQVPLKSLISASNEVPLHEAGLDALYDRFLVRLVVNPIDSQESFRSLLTDPKAGEFSFPVSMKITDEMLHSWKLGIGEVSLSEETVEAMVKARAIIAEQVDLSDLDAGPADTTFDLSASGDEESYGHLTYVSDRRWTQAAKLLKASAYFNGRNKTSSKDFLALKHCLWNTGSDRDSFCNLVSDLAREMAKKDLLPKSVFDRLERSFSKDSGESWRYLMEQLTEHRKACSDIIAKFDIFGISVRIYENQAYFCPRTERAEPTFSKTSQRGQMNQIEFRRYLSDNEIGVGSVISCRVMSSGNSKKLLWKSLLCIPDDSFDIASVEPGTYIDMKICAADAQKSVIFVTPSIEENVFWLPFLDYESGKKYTEVYSPSMERTAEYSFGVNFVAESDGNYSIKFLLTNSKDGSEIERRIRAEFTEDFAIWQKDLVKEIKASEMYAKELKEVFALADRDLDAAFAAIDTELFLDREDKRTLKEVFFDLAPNFRRAKSEFLDLQNACQ